MLLDTLGIIIGFITIVLLLSILVTAIVQTITSMFRMRNYTLREGLKQSDVLAALRTATGTPVLETEPAATPAGEPKRGGGKPPEVAKLPEEAAQAREQLFKRIERAVVEAQSTEDLRATWLDDKQVIEPLKAAELMKTEIALVQHALDEARRKAEDLLLRWSRSLTFAFSVIVAFAFAASVPDILKRLNSDADFRARAEALGEKIVHDTPSEYSAIVLGPAGLRARTTFLSKYPQYAVQLGALRFESLAVDDLVANFETAMDAEPQRDALAAEYRALVEKELAEEGSKAADAARRAVGDLASIGLEPIRDFSFYVVKDAGGKYHVHGDRIAGVLFMAVLMSFGAAFWYRALKELVGLKDALRKRDDVAESKVEAKIVATTTHESKAAGS
jgi:hypothetical protein